MRRGRHAQCHHPACRYDLSIRAAGTSSKRSTTIALVHGILVQMPLPRHLDADAVIRSIDPRKDVDGFHPVNVGKLLIGERDGFVPCTPAGIQEMLRRSGVETSGAECVIVGRSNIVGKPMAALLDSGRKGCKRHGDGVSPPHSRSRVSCEACRHSDRSSRTGRADHR